MRFLNDMAVEPDAHAFSAVPADPDFFAIPLRRRAAAARGQGPARLQRLGCARVDGGLRAALHAARLPPLEPLARGAHRLRRLVLPGAGGRGRDAAGAARLHQRRAGDPGDGAADLPGRAAHQRLRRAPRRGHGPAHPRRGLRLPGLHGDLAGLRLLHVHLLRAGSGGDGLRAGPGVRHPAGLGLPALRAGGDPAGDARRHHHQPAAALDPAAVAADARHALRGGAARAARAAAELHGARGRGRQRGVRPAGLRRGDDRRHRPDPADGRAGRLPALHARGRAGPARACAMVGGGADGRAGLGDPGRAEDAGRRAAGAPGAHAHGAHGAGGGPQPHVPRGLRVRVRALRLGGGRHGAVRGGVAAQDQRHQRLRGLAGLEQFLLARHAQPPGARGVDGVQHPHRAGADGDGRVPGAGPRAGAVRQRGGGLDHGRGGGPGDQQAAGLVAAGHRVPPRAPARRQPGGAERHGAGVRPLHRRAPGRLRPAGPGFFRADRHGHGAADRAAGGLGHARAFLHRARDAGAGPARARCWGQHGRRDIHEVSKPPRSVRAELVEALRRRLGACPSTSLS